MPFIVDAPPPPPRVRSARSAPSARAEPCLFSTVPATFQQPVLATFWRRSSGHLNVARTSPEQVVGTSPEQGVWVRLASLAHPCLQEGMTEGEAVGAPLAAPPSPAPLGALGATRSEPRSSSALASPAPPPPQGAPTRPPWATPAHRPLEPPRRAPQGAAPVAPLQAHRPQLPEPSTGSSMSKGGGVGEQAVVLGELQEARGNVETIRRRLKKWSAKLAEYRRRGDLTGGGNASERVLEGNRRVRLRRPFTHVDFVAKRHNSGRFQHPFFAPQKSISFFRPTPRGFSSWDTTTLPFVASRGVRIHPLFRAEK